MHFILCMSLIFIIVSPLLKQVEDDGIKPEVEKVGELAQFASNYPYYKYLLPIIEYVQI